MTQNNYESAMQINLAARECLQKGDLHGALGNLSRALELLPEDQVESKARLHSNKGLIEARLKAYDDALSSFRQAAGIYERLGERIALGEQIGNAGSVYRDMEQWDAALENYSKSLSVFQAVDHKKGIADQYCNIGYVHSQQRRPESALQYFEDAKVLYDAAGEQARSQLCEQNIQHLKSLLEK